MRYCINNINRLRSLLDSLHRHQFLIKALDTQGLFYIRRSAFGTSRWPMKQERRKDTSQFPFAFLNSANADMLSLIRFYENFIGRQQVIDIMRDDGYFF